MTLSNHPELPLLEAALVLPLESDLHKKGLDPLGNSSEHILKQAVQE